MRIPFWYVDFSLAGRFALPGAPPAVAAEWRDEASAEAQPMELNGHACAIRLTPV